MNETNSDEDLIFTLTLLSEAKEEEPIRIKASGPIILIWQEEHLSIYVRILMAFLDPLPFSINFRPSYFITSIYVHPTNPLYLIKKKKKI